VEYVEVPSGYTSFHTSGLSLEKTIEMLQAPVHLLHLSKESGT
jgi:hypothetical protein